MKLVILAGGNKSSISDSEEGIPKPMLEIGDRPLLWHIMKHASTYGINEFIICGGYKIDMIKKYFQNFYIYQSDIEINTNLNEVKVLKNRCEDWKVTVINTGLHVSTAERILQIKSYTKDDDFIVMYGDCLTDLNFETLIKNHRNNKRIATMAVAHPTGRKSALVFDSSGEIENTLDMKKETNSNAWVSAGIFVFTKKIYDYLEENLNEKLDIEDILMKYGKEIVSFYQYNGFWISIETLRDKVFVDNLWLSGKATWVDTL